jgi:parallel beta-helix repeat protein
LGEEIIQNSLKKKGLIIFALGILLMVPIFSVNGYEILTSKSIRLKTTYDSSSIYGLSNMVYNKNTGENFQTIQEAIDDIDTKDGHTIKVNVGIYPENVIVHKSINLKGENRQKTIIDGEGNDNVLNITAPEVNVHGFTIQNSGYEKSGILINSNFNNINWNNIDNNWYGVLIWYASNNSIEGNNIGKNEFGILVFNSIYNNLNWNKIDGNENGIDMWDSSYNNVKGNRIINTQERGMLMGHSPNNNIFWNNIRNSNTGIYLWSHSDNNVFYQNNFFNNSINADDECNNYWDNGKKGNYWDDYEEKCPNANKIWLKGIWDTQYDIYGGNNKDIKPLCRPYIQSNLKMIFNYIFIFIKVILK